MEDLVERYAPPDEPQRPVLGCDERPDQLRAKRRAPWPKAPGRVKRIDYEAERKGACHLCMVCQPLRGWRPVEVTHQRSHQAFAPWMQAVVAD
jgi:hypothetical protein